MTKIIKAISGIEYEFDEITGVEQRLLTEKKNGSLSKRLNLLLVSCLKRGGSVKLDGMSKEDRMSFVLSLLSGDRTDILIGIRQYTADEDLGFSFDYKYKSVKDGDDYDKPKTDFVTGELSFERRDYKIMTGEIDEKGFPVLEKMQVNEVSEIQRYYIITLPKCGKKVRFTLLDGNGEARAAMMKESDFSSHSPIEVRSPVYEQATNKEGELLKTPVWIKLDLDKLGGKDIEYLRRVIKSVEGEVTATCTFKHPQAELLSESESKLTIDALSNSAFFFSSGAI